MLKKIQQLLGHGFPAAGATLLLLNALTMGLLIPVMSLLYLNNGLTLEQLPLVSGVFAVTVMLLSFLQGLLLIPTAENELFTSLSWLLFPRCLSCALEEVIP